MQYDNKMRYSILTLLILLGVTLYIIHTGNANIDIQQDSEKTNYKEDVVDINKLVAQTKSKNPYEQECAFKALGDLGEKAKPTIPYLIQLVGSDDDAMHQGSYRSLYLLGSNAVDPLIKELNDQKNQRHLYMCIVLLGEIGDHKAINPILPFLTDNNPKLREAATVALSKMPDLSAFDSLLIVLKDKNAQVRKNAISALGEIGDRRASLPLFELFKSEKDVEVKTDIALVLGRLKYQPAVDELILLLSDLGR